MDKLGIEPSLLLAQIVNFTIIMVVLNVLLYKPILTMLEKRKKKIEEGLKLTETMKEEEEKLEIKKQKILADAKKDAQGIIEEGRKHGKEEEKAIIEEARKEAEGIMEKGRLALLKEKDSMEEAMKKEAVSLGVAMAKRLLSESMTKDLQHKVLQKHIHDIESL